MQEEKDDSDERMSQFIGKVTNYSQRSRCMRALLYKSLKLQQKNYCSTICQILTPLLCLLFTIVVRILTQNIASSQIKTFEYPQPFDLPIVNSLIPGISCKQLYFYQVDQQNQQSQVQSIFKHILKKKCPQTNMIQPEFRKITNINDQIINILKVADRQPFERGQDLKTEIPDGFVKFHNISKNSYNLTIAINDLRLPQYHRNNAITKIAMKHKDGSYAMITAYLRVTEGAMSLVEKLNRAFLMRSHPKQVIMGSYMYMPFEGQDRNFMDKIVNLVGSALYPLGLSLLLPLFLYAIISEKEERLIEIMKMNGLDVKYYWIVVFITNFILSMVVFSVFYFSGLYLLQINIFTGTSFYVIWCFLIGWAIAQISLTTFVQIFLSDSKTASIVGYVLSIFSTLIGQPLCLFVYPNPTTLPILLLMYPPFALSRGFYLISLACSEDSCFSSFSDTSFEMIDCIYVLYGWSLIFIVSIWLNDMIQQDYGVAKTPAIITFFKRFFFRKPEEDKKMTELQSVSQNLSDSFEEQTIQYDKIDQSVLKQANFARQTVLSDAPLVCRELSKKYQHYSGKKEYIALKPLSLVVRQREILGLLGPNGAGKTTLLSVLTGMYPKTSGSGWIKGQEVGDSATNRNIGVCPQFDLLWPELTVYEHLKFYCLLKGVESDKITELVSQYISDFDLVEWANSPSKQLSGGMKRRLSIANGLVGNPSIVFLDEPSSGLDPGHRRQLWNILLKCAKRTSIILTTHLMEEAEVLCDRVGIIDHGRLKCIGSIHDLKERFGKGYRLTLNLTNPDQVNKMELINLMVSKMNASVIGEIATKIVLKINKNQLIKIIQLIKGYNGMTWEINQPSLYDVFVDFVK